MMMMKVSMVMKDSVLHGCSAISMCRGVHGVGAECMAGYLSQAFMHRFHSYQIHQKFLVFFQKIVYLFLVFFQKIESLFLVFFQMI